jgi:competence protein ComEC
MRKAFSIPFWIKIPLLRILVPFIAGIALQWYLQIPIALIIVLSAISLSVLVGYYFLSLARKYTWRWMTGISINLLLFCLGNILVLVKDIRNNLHWLGKSYQTNYPVLVTLQEPLVEKTKSYKALAAVEAIQINGEWKAVKGNILLYFKKDSSKPNLNYGYQLIFTKALQPINNSGNPGAFDYQRFCAFQDIHHQVFLKESDYAIAATNQQNSFWQWLFDVREYVLSVLRKNIKGDNEQAVAEALLIGYRDDLDKDLVQAYSNTGVVHIIAISGLHLGMIYATLVWLLKPMRKSPLNRWLKPIIILTVLWLFSLVAGAAPSILRSAVMFTFIVLGESFSRKTSIYNTLAASAFSLLLYNPFFLWDVGFQLSYAAVISIIIFMKPVYNWLHFDNKGINFFWQLNAVTIAAQTFTLPIVLYHFHQFPNLFLLSNFVAVPLSSLILYGELLLLLFSAVPFFAEWIGMLCSKMLWAMNAYIERIDSISFSVTDGIQINSLQAYLLFGVLIAAGHWLLRQNKVSFSIATLFLFAFCGVQSFDIIQRNVQQKLVVYNVPQHPAIDIIEGRQHYFLGDAILLEDGFLQNFHLKPARILHRTKRTLTTNSTTIVDSVFIGSNKTVLWIKGDSYYNLPAQKITVDAIIISKNPRLNMAQLAASFDCKQYIFDASNPLWKINKWKKDCDSLHLRHHSIPEKGAFEMAL